MTTMTTHSQNDERPLLMHLIELRRRLMVIAFCVLVIFIGLYLKAASLYEFFATPLLKALSGQGQMVTTDVTASFFTPIKLALIISFLLAMPIILQQIWGFIAKGLYRKERWLGRIILGFSIVLFYGGVVVSYYIVFPLVFHFFISKTPDHIQIMTDIRAYLSFSMKLMLIIGVIFEIPIVIVALVQLGFVEYKTLSKNRKYMILICFIGAMFISPPDVISQTLFAIPMIILFELGLLLSRILTYFRN